MAVLGLDTLLTIITIGGASFIGNKFGNILSPKAVAMCEAAIDADACTADQKAAAKVELPGFLAGKLHAKLHAAWSALFS